MCAAGKKVWEIRSRPTKRMSKAGRAGSAEDKEKAGSADGSAGGSAGGSAEDKEKVHQRLPSTERLWEVLGEGKGKGKRKGKGNVVMQRARARARSRARARASPKANPEREAWIHEERNLSFGEKGERHPNFGEKLSDEQKLKISAANKGEQR